MKTLSQNIFYTVKSTIPVLEEHGETLTKYFYKARPSPRASP